MNGTRYYRSLNMSEGKVREQHLRKNVWYFVFFLFKSSIRESN